MTRFFPRGRISARSMMGFPRFNARSFSAARQGMGRMLRLNTRRFGSMTMTRRGRGRTSGRGITTQYDRSLIYRKRRMPRWRKRSWRRFNKKVLAVSEKDLGSRTVVRNSLIEPSAIMNLAAATLHTTEYVALYSLQDGVRADMNDIQEMSNDTDLGVTGKALFKSAVIDITVRNTSERLEESRNPPITLEVDVYEITSGMLWGQVDHAGNLTQVFDEGAGDTATIPGQVNALARTQRGWTPWDFPSALSEYKMRIWKKTKYFVGENQTFTYQSREPRRKLIDRQKMTFLANNMPGLTRFFFFVIKPTPGYIYSDTTPDTYRLSIGFTRKYLYKIMDKSQDYDMYNA